MIPTPTKEAGEADGEAKSPQPDQPRSLRQRVVRGFLVSIGGVGAGQFLRFVSNLVMSRLLFPEAFGVMVLIWSVLFGLELLSDVGFGPAIIRHEKGDNQRFLDTAWTLGIFRGVALWLLASALSPVMAAIYDEPLLLQTLPVAAFSTCIKSLSSTKLFSARRRLELGRITLIEVAGRIAALSIMIPWALLAPSIWPLVCGALLASSVRAVLSHVVLPGQTNRLRFDREDARDLWDFGRWIIIGSSLHFVCKQGDRLLVGRLASLAVLGVYGIAGQLTNALGMVAFKLSRQVLFPALSTVARKRRPDVRRAFYQVRLRTDLAIQGGHGVVSAAAVFLVGLLYDDRYIEGGWMLSILCMRGSLSYAADTCQSCLVALCRLEYQVKPVIVRTVGVVLGLPLGWYFGGVAGLIWASVLSEVPPILVLWKGLAEEKVWRFDREMIGFGFFALAFVATRGLLSIVPL